MKLKNVSPKNIKIGIKIEGLPITTFRYIKLDIINNNGNPITSVGDVSYIINSTPTPNITMLDFTTGSFEVVDWSGYYNNNSLYEPWKAFDNQTGTNNRWLTDNTGSQFVTLDIGQSKDVSDFTEVRILPANHNSDDWTTRSIRNFKVLVSEDNNTFYEVLYETGINDWQSGVEKSFPIT
jgi:hypothetical protein